jgi:hypothetical protein
MTTIDAAALNARRCAISTCANWTNHATGLCARCRERGLNPPPPPPTAQLKERLRSDGQDKLESEVQTECIEVLEMCGYTVSRVGQYDAERTQDAGFPDLTGLKPAPPPAHGLVFVECKRSRGGVQSDEQRDFQLRCEAANIPYILTNSPHHLFARLTELKPRTET